jgi:GAF domain-containing protein
MSRALDHGVEEYLLASQVEVLLSHEEIVSFTQKREIDFRGSMPYSLLGVPLRMEDRTIGGVIVCQYSVQGSEYIENDKRVLLSVADQVAGAIQISRLAEAEREETRRMQVLHTASMEMLRIAQENEDHFWLTLLTIATSDFGLGFNRALLFVEEENVRRLCGRMGVGTDNVEEARRDWERDERRSYNFQSFLADLKTGKRRTTAFENRIRQVEFDFDHTHGSDAVSQVFREKAKVLIPEEEVNTRLPGEITQAFSLTHCAILPLRVGEKVAGVVIVDNKHNRELLKERSLIRLQSLLDNAGLVYQTLLEQKKSASLLSANYEILEGAKDQSLQITLSRICHTAQAFTGADWVIILPLLEGGNRQFDLGNIGFAGTLKTSLKEVIGDSPHFGGISQGVIRKGTLVVDNIEDRKNSVNRQLKISEHHFIKSEGVVALIGAVIHSQDDEEPLGLLYLDYREPQEFSDLEKQQALSFASLAGVAISNARRMDELQQRRQLKAVKEIAETIGLGLNLESTMDAVLKTLHNLFEQTHLCVLLYQSDERVLKFAPGTLKYYKIQNSEFRKQDTFHLDRAAIACRVARASIQHQRVEFENVGDVGLDVDYLPLNPKVLSEFCVSLLSTTNELLGILVLERTWRNGFDSDDADLIKLVAQHLSIAIQRAQQSEELEFRSTVAAQTAWAADIAHEINNEVDQIRNLAYMLRGRLESGSDLQMFADQIEESASTLLSTGPWSDQPPQVIKLDPFLHRHVSKLASQRNIPVDFQLHTPEVYIEIKPVQLEHVIRHLVRNAGRAMSNSRGRMLTILTRPANGSQVEILFRDSGPGISKEVQLSIFQRPISTKSRGGYGLLLVRQMIDDMKGQIRLVPQSKGRGATFSIRFPIASLMDGTVE